MKQEQDLIPNCPPHDSSLSHAKGASEYVDDRPLFPNELICGLVYSKQAHGRIKNLDLSTALNVAGVAAIITAKDVHHNQWGPVFKDQPIIASDKVQFVGEVLAVVAAESPTALRKALNLIQVDYEPFEPIFSIEQAIHLKSFFGEKRKIERGEVDHSLSHAQNKLSGKIIIGGADHFYLENNAAIAYPKEDGQIEVHSSTQHPTETQHVVAEACGLPFSDVVCVVKRLGGGFGGKESQAAPIAAYAALVAQKTLRPSRLILSKDDDMIITGKRNPFEIHYQCGFKNDGTLEALDVQLYSDAGAYADLSTAIMERAMLHCDNAYYIPNMRVVGQACKTNFHPHTAFRGFGGPKGVAVIESLIEDIAFKLKMDPIDVRTRNCYRPGFDLTHYCQKVDNNMLPALFKNLIQSSHYRERRKEITEWNQSSQTSVRGLSLTAVKFGISFTTRFLNQGNALVNIHRDGSVQISTGAVEMGQGVNQRIAMLVANELGLSLQKVRVMTTSTEKNANTSPTAASSGTDINGAAALKAAQLIKLRLSKLALKLASMAPAHFASKTAGIGNIGEIELEDNQPCDKVVFQDQKVFIPQKDSRSPSFEINFHDLINEAYLNRISVCEYSHYKIENLGFNKLTGTGQAFLYFTQGVAASEVEVSKLTGEVKVRRVDILMDLGRPINEALDIGQVRGAFIQGMGWVTTENLVYNSSGLLVTHSPSTYKIPSIQDTPRVFNVELLENNENLVNVKGTKAVGEPPLLLSISVWTAIKNALSYVPDSKTSLPIPATNEAVLRAMKPMDFLGG